MQRHRVRIRLSLNDTYAWSKMVWTNPIHRPASVSGHTVSPELYKHYKDAASTDKGGLGVVNLDAYQ